MDHCFITTHYSQWRWFTNLLLCDIPQNKAPCTGPHHIWRIYTLCPFFGCEKNTDGSRVGLLWPVLVMATLESQNIFCAQTWSSNQPWLFRASSIKFLYRRSLKSQEYLAPHEDNCIQLSSTVTSRKQKNNFVVHLKVRHLIEQFLTTRSELSTKSMCWLYCSMTWGFTGLLPLQKFPSAGGGSMLACTLLICPSKLMQSHLPWSSPLCHPFSISVHLVQSHEACLVRWTILYCTNVFYICQSHQKVLGMKWNCP